MSPSDNPSSGELTGERPAAPPVDGPTANGQTAADAQPVPAPGERPAPRAGGESVPADHDQVRPSGTRRRGSVGALFRSELKLVFGRARTLVLLGVLAGFPLLVGIAIRLSGESDGEGFIGQVAGNGFFLVVASLGMSLPFFLPTAVTVIAGESLAGEASLGTLRSLLTAPAGRTRLLLAKLVALTLFCFAATFTVWLSGLIVGVVLFPVGDVVLLSGSTIPLSDGLIRALLIAVVIAGSLLGLAGIGLFVSSMTSTPLAAMAATFGSFVVLGILTAIPQLHDIHPWLLMFRWTSFADLLRDPPYWDEILRNLGLQGAYLLVFATAAWARLTSRDING